MDSEPLLQIVLAADFLLTANWLIGACGVVYSLLIPERANYEEQMMSEAFGEEYGAYMRRAGRFLPRLIHKSD